MDKLIEYENIFQICEHFFEKQNRIENPNISNFPKHFSKTWTFLEFVKKKIKAGTILNLENKFGSANFFYNHGHFLNLENKF